MDIVFSGPISDAVTLERVLRDQGVHALTVAVMFVRIEDSGEARRIVGSIGERRHHMTSARNLLRNDPQLAANTVLIVDRLMPRMNDAVRLAGDKYPSSPKKECAFVSGAVYGIVSSYLHDHSEDVTAHQVGAAAATVCQFIEMLFSAKYDGDMDRLAHDLVPEAFTEGGAA